MLKRPRGFTLTELAIVLGVIGTILGGIWVASAQANQQAKYNKAVQEYITIVQNFRTLYGASAQLPFTSHDGTLTATLINAGIFPSEMVVGSSTLIPQGVTNPWGTETIVYLGSTTYFEVQMDTIPVDACKNVLANLIPKATQLGMINYFDDAWNSTSGNPDITNIKCTTGNMSTEFSLH